jgi:hypothetical protein
VDGTGGGVPYLDDTSSSVRVDTHPVRKLPMTIAKRSITDLIPVLIGALTPMSTFIIEHSFFVGIYLMVSAFLIHLGIATYLAYRQTKLRTFSCTAFMINRVDGLDGRDERTRVPSTKKKQSDRFRIRSAGNSRLDSTDYLASFLPF